MPLKLMVRLFLAVWLVAACGNTAEAGQLGSYSIAANRIFVAGVSSGAAMAVQLNVAYSGTFKGAAIYAGVPYYCAGYDQLSAARATAGCSRTVPRAPLADVEKVTRSWADQGLIDPVQNLQNSLVYLWSGRSDLIVQPTATNELRSFYSDFGTNVFHYDNQFPAGHGWESPYGPVPCNRASAPFINRCYDSPDDGAAYDSEEVWLSRFFGPLQPKAVGPLHGALLTFDQTRFAPGGAAAKISMADTGYVFVPRSCADGHSCGLMLALHGCEQSASIIGDTFIHDAGINEWADSNNIVVLYPQAIASPENLLGCWDWWGYLNDRDYAQKSGPQIKALYNMVVHISRGSASLGSNRAAVQPSPDNR
jgi:poly(3-hydroxybutyrate) depolymerase